MLTESNYSFAINFGVKSFKIRGYQGTQAGLNSRLEQYNNFSVSGTWLGVNSRTERIEYEREERINASLDNPALDSVVLFVKGGMQWVYCSSELNDGECNTHQ